MNYKKILRKGTPLILAGGLLTGSIMLSGSEQPTEGENAEEGIPASIDFPLPERLTPKEPIYDKPKQEFLIYSRAYERFTTDDELSTGEIEALEYILDRLVEEIGKKSEELWDINAIRSEAEQKYVTYVLGIKSTDLKELRLHLEKKEEWLASTVDRYWHHGSGKIVNLSTPYTGNIHKQDRGDRRKGEPVYLRNLFNPSKEIEHFKSGLYNSRENLLIRDFIDDYPWEDKIPYSLGLFMGLLLPGLFSYGVRRIRGEEFIGDGENGGTSDYINIIANPVAGFILLDSIHPMVYPVRIAAALVCPYIFPSEKKKTGKVQVEEPETEPPEIEPPKAKIIDPWEVEIPEIKSTLEVRKDSE